MKIKVTEFAERHFDKKFGGTKILDMTSEEFESHVQKVVDYHCGAAAKDLSYLIQAEKDIAAYDGYAPFCKLLAIPNFTDARVGSLPITLENYQYLRSGYSARRDGELPVFSRWIELPLGKPKAEWLVLVLYDKEQIDKEAEVEYNKIEYPSPLDIPKPFDADWGIVAILGENSCEETPMKPETMLRNALGIEEGGSGVPLDKEKYLKSVAYWEKHATVK